eukprot:CAMPEP_0195516170 /NCGR_PEP_ID=MMETSP0794_2-20130614/6972_1 /TAXON_ID=515487 /ORGANISM="Stephanopyxis turris, Strain CCMP 815" /LENGTH=727 /DNA_ID=CAMNT_0040644695 /DNA_START=38 /DNA_END=2221 /DNA_ORIENTATION=-
MSYQESQQMNEGGNIVGECENNRLSYASGHELWISSSDEVPDEEVFDEQVIIDREIPDHDKRVNDRELSDSEQQVPGAKVTDQEVGNEEARDDNALDEDAHDEDAHDEDALDDNALDDNALDEEPMDEATRRKNRAMGERFEKWASSFRRCDPRYKILKFFNDVKQEGADNLIMDGDDYVVKDRRYLKLQKVLSVFNTVGVLTVWRPTSMDAIRLMMLGQGVGKGLDIKGKSAKTGELSGFVPFLQIFEEKHKHVIRSLKKGTLMRCFYSTIEARDEVVEWLEHIAREMIAQVEEAKQFYESFETEKFENAFFHMGQWELTSASVTKIDDCAPQSYGIELPQQLFWEGYVMLPEQDISRRPGTKWYTGRPSEPGFQNMNIISLKEKPDRPPGSPKPVVWQYSKDEPKNPLTLLMAYEERGRVMPVVSDFDCFLVGMRREALWYGCNLPGNQIDLMNWSVSQIESILDSEATGESWTVRWLEVMKKAPEKYGQIKVPEFGFGDPKSISIVEQAVDRLADTGAVRHGSENFNFIFPQELDDEFLVISDTLPGKLRWKYVDAAELLQILSDKVDDGFSFPVNPKWVLCDPGWKHIYDKLLASTALYAEHSMEVWYPPESGIRDKIEAIHTKHPGGFKMGNTGFTKFKRRQSIILREKACGSEAKDLAELELANPDLNEDLDEDCTRSCEDIAIPPPKSLRPYPRPITNFLKTIFGKKKNKSANRKNGISG